MIFLRNYLDALPFAAMLLVAIMVAALSRILAPAFSMVALWILIAPPLLLLALLPLARLTLDAGPSELPKGELKHLLTRKRGGMLDLSRPRFEHAGRRDSINVDTESSVSPLGVLDGNVLDRLLQWKHRARRSAKRA